MTFSFVVWRVIETPYDYGSVKIENGEEVRQLDLFLGETREFGVFGQP